MTVSPYILRSLLVLVDFDVDDCFLAGRLDLEERLAISSFSAEDRRAFLFLGWAEASFIGFVRFVRNDILSRLLSQ